MYRISDSTWVIEDREEFSAECGAAGTLLAHVREEHSGDGVSWEFVKCFASWERDEYTAVFQGRDAAGPEEPVLTVAATREGEEWAVRTVRLIRHPGGD